MPTKARVLTNMLEIFSARKLKVGSLPSDGNLLVCVRGHKGDLILITEL